MADEKRFIIPLRKEFSKAPRYKRAKKTVSAVRKFISKHMKVGDVRIGKNLNHLIWSRGSKNPPPRVEVHSIIEEKYARVELVGHEFEEKVEPVKKEEVKEKLEEKVEKQESKEELAKEGKVEEKEEKAVNVPSEEIKDIQNKQKEVRVLASRRNLGRNPGKEVKDTRKRTGTNKKKTG